MRTYKDCLECNNVEWRYNVYKRDNFTCQLCNTKFRKMNAHHLTSFVNIIKENNIVSIEDAEDCELLWDNNNGITLCVECHKKIHFGDKD